MSDFLLELSRRPLAKSLVRQLRLPVPLPEPLLRASGPWSETELSGHISAVGGTRQGQLQSLIKTIINSAGGQLADNLVGSPRLNSLVFDARSMGGTSDLGSLYDFIKPRLASLSASARVVLIGLHPESAPTAELSAAGSALLGFTKSLSKELGRKGSTCNLLSVKSAGDTLASLDTPLKFLLSRRSAFISGQCIVVGPLENTSIAPTHQPLAGKIALVTGAAQGIGSAIARRLSAEGATVIGHDRPQERATLTALMEDLKGTTLIADLLDPGATRTIINQLQENYPHIDILVNNAGITRDKTLLRMPRDWWDDTLAINLTAPLRLTESLLAARVEDDRSLMPDGSSILCMASVAGIAGNTGQTNYATAKSGLMGMVRALAHTAAKRRVTINALAPGFIETRMTAAMPVTIREVARRFNALSQGGLPDDVAEAATFLVMPGAASINGAVLRVCGQNLIGA